MRIIAIGLSALILASCVPAEHKRTQANQVNCRPGNPEKNRLAPLIGEKGGPPSLLELCSNEEPPECPNSCKNDEGWSIPSIAKKSSLTDWLLFAATVAIAYFAIKQASYTFEAAKSASKQAEIALKSLEASSRPWVVFTPYQRQIRDPANSLRLEYWYDCTNFGNGPAVLEAVKCWHFTANEPPAGSTVGADGQHLQSTTNVLSGNAVGRRSVHRWGEDIAIPILHVSGSSNVREYLMGRRSVILLALVEYRDSEFRPHATRQAFRYDFHALGGRGDWERMDHRWNEYT